MFVNSVLKSVFCVVQSSKKLTFEIQMQEKGCHLLAAESESELDEWVTALKRALECEDRQFIGDKVKEKGNSIDFVTLVLICSYHVFIIFIYHVFQPS